MESEDDEEKIGEKMKTLEQKLRAKKEILKEVLRTVEDEKGQKESQKTRKNIRNMLHCEVSLPSEQNRLVTVNLLDVVRFDSHVIARFRLVNRSSHQNLIVKTSSFPAASRLHWILFENETSLKTSEVVSSSSILFVSIPFSTFFLSDSIALVLQIEAVPVKTRLSASLHSLLHRNRGSDAPPEAVISIPVKMSKATEELDLKGIEFVEEKKAIQLVQSIFICFCRLPCPSRIDLSLFRREFPSFSCIDFDIFRILIGREQFENVFIWIEEDEKIQIFARNLDSCRKFLQLVNRTFEK